MHHLTVLAAAFALSGDERYAERAASHLRSWWAQNPFLSGVHWTSGIETGLRLICWVWVRRLLDGWEGATELFERNEMALCPDLVAPALPGVLPQSRIVGQQSRDRRSRRPPGGGTRLRLVRREPSLGRGGRRRSRAGAGETTRSRVASTERWPSNTTVSSPNWRWSRQWRPIGPGVPSPTDLWALLYRMLDVVAATVDVRLRGSTPGGRRQREGACPRSPDRRAVAGPPRHRRGACSTPRRGGRRVEPTVTSTLLASMAGAPRASTGTQNDRPSHFADAGLTLMRSSPSDGEEIWCRCDAGPHGFLSIAAHAHADALAVEVRHDGTDVLADPGTYCYHGEPPLAQLLSLDSGSQHDRG